MDGMQLITTIKKNWVVIADLAIIIVVFLTDIIKPPYIPENISISALNVFNASKFIVIATLIFMAILVASFNQRKHAFIYIGLSIVAFVSASIAFLFYLSTLNQVTAYNSIKKQRFVIGNKYLKEANEAIVEQRKKEPNLLITPSLLLEGYGDPVDIWYPEGIEQNAKKLVLQYLLIVTSAGCFIIAGLQSVKIVN
jgi:hypothetical protein